MKKILLTILSVIVLLLGSTYIIYLNSRTSNQLENTKIENNADKENIKNKTEKNNLVSYNGSLKLNGVDLVNQYNEKIQLKGISTHGLQWYSKYANEEVMKTLRDKWTSNLFRIAMYTEEGGYISNKSLEDKVNEIVSIAVKLDMYVIIDWHILSDNNPNIHINESKEFFSRMAKKYKNTPNVIFEICNEPNGNVTWNNDIKPYAIEIIKIIREYSKDSIIIVGTPTWSQDVDKVISNKIDDDKVMYAVHFYAGTHTNWLRDRITNARNNNIPIFVSEWGTSAADGNGGIYLDEALKWTNYMMENNISWANWSLSDKEESSALLKSGTPANNINDNYLTESGKFVKEQIKK